MVIKIIKETAYGIQERCTIEMEALGMNKNHVHLLLSVHPKISPGGDSENIQKYYCQGDIPKASRDQKRTYGVDNFGLMDTMLQLLAREETGQKRKIIYKNKVNQRKIETDKVVLIFDTLRQVAGSFISPLRY